MKKIKEEIFTNPNTPLGAYLLGLIWADGHITNRNKNTRGYAIYYSTTEPDSEYFYKMFCISGDWLDYKKEIRERMAKISHTFYINNRNIHQFLLNNDYQSKSWNSADKILEKIPENLHRFWFLGLLDGDGCIYFDEKGSYCVDFSSGINQDWNFLEKFLNKNNIKYKIRKQITDNGSSSRIKITGVKNIVLFCNLIYSSIKSDSIGLNRKYQKYLDLLERLKSKKPKGIRQLKGGTWQAYYNAKINGKFHQVSLGCYKEKEAAQKAASEKAVELGRLDYALIGS